MLTQKISKKNKIDKKIVTLSIMAKKAWSLVQTFFPEFMFAAVPGIFIANGLCRDSRVLWIHLESIIDMQSFQGIQTVDSHWCGRNGKGLFALYFTFIYSLYSNDSNPLTSLIKVSVFQLQSEWLCNSLLADLLWNQVSMSSTINST